jgi:hypothetical protein
MSTALTKIAGDCEGILPSGKHATALFKAPTAEHVFAVSSDVLLRGVLIAMGIFALGERDPKKLFVHALGGSLAIEAFVLAWTAKQSMPSASSRPAGANPPEAK